MGGFGSGGHNARKATVEHYRNIDIRRWQREGLLNGKRRFVWSWQENGQQVASIGVAVQENHLTLGYAADNENIKIQIYLEKTACNYGGFRYWFTCPGCRGRCAKLFLREKLFRCRNCQRLNYASSKKSGNHIDTIDHKIIKVYRKLKAHAANGYELMERVPFKPRGMHWKTYNGLTTELIRLQRARANTFRIQATKLLERIS